VKLFAVTVNAKGKAFAMLFFSIVVLPLAPVMANPIIKRNIFFMLIEYSHSLLKKNYPI